MIFAASFSAAILAMAAASTLAEKYVARLQVGLAIVAEGSLRARPIRLAPGSTARMRIRKERN